MQQRFGHHFHNGQVTFSAWAPNCRRLELELKRDGSAHAMQRTDDGWYSLTLDNLQHGDGYRFRLHTERGDVARPDPAGQWFESSVHQWTCVVDHERFEWQVRGWTGLAQSDLIIYELHIGTFTAEGTFRSAMERIDELVELGITAIELLPLAQCPGRWNWGYDGVGIYAAQNTYGTPEDLKAFVDACHGKGVAVILDVVFNHLGPEGNYLAEFAPFFTNKRKTPWGDALNFDSEHGEHVRRFMAQCAADWIKHYRLDGLRVDAVHFMFDDSDVPVSMEVTQAVDDLAATLNREVHLIGETNVRNASLTKVSSPYGTGFDANWCDGIMHSVLSIAQPGLDLCHRDHRGKNDLALAIEQGFLYENFPYERHDLGIRADLDTCVVGLQNHDTVGNHPLGQRIHQLASLDFQKAAAALVLLYPAIPMIFMGEEYAAEDPFLFFVDFHDPWVREGVERGRVGEFPELNAALDGLSPLDPASFERSKLRAADRGNQDMRKWYQQLIAFRKRMRDSGLLNQHQLVTESKPEQGLYVLHYQDQENGKRQLTVAIRLVEPSSKTAAIDFEAAGELVMDSQTVSSVKTETPGGIHANQALVFYREDNS